MACTPQAFGGCVLGAFIVVTGLPAYADPAQEAARAVLERSQQSESFALQLRQSQELLRVSPSGRVDMEARQREQRARQGDLHQQQVLQTSSPASSTSPGDADRLERDRRALSMQPDAAAAHSWGPRLDRRK